MGEGAPLFRAWDRASLLLLLIIAALGAVIYLEANTGLFAPRPVPSAQASSAVTPPSSSSVSEPSGGAQSSQTASQEESEEQAEAAVAVILARPLFSPGRRPASAPGRAKAGAAQGLKRYALAGVAKEGDRSMALLRGRSGADYLRLAPGETHDGWRLVTIGEEGVLFEAVEGGKRHRADRVPDRLIIDREGARPATQ